MAITEEAEERFNLLAGAFETRDVCLIQMYDQVDRKMVDLIAKVIRNGEEYLIRPFAVLLEGNPLERFIDPVVEAEVAE